MKTKIIATIGPATLDILEKINKAGSKRFRLNLSHGTIDWHRDAIRKIKKMENSPEIILDTKGPDIRTGKIKGELEIKKGDIVNLEYGKIGGEKNGVLSLEIDYEELNKKVVSGSEIAIDSGKIILIVEKIEGRKIITKSLNSGFVSSLRHVNVPGIRIDLPILTKGDKEIIKMGIEEGINSIALSFARDKNDVEKIKKFAPGIRIISKIESLDGLMNIDEIIEISDEIMIARGDLGIEIPFYKLPIIENRILKKCNRSAKPSIVATQMLASMTKNPIPTRAEVSDIASAVQFGANSIMLSEETASGEHPVEAVETMKKIADFIEKSEDLII